MSSYVIVDFIHGDMFYVKTEKKIIFVKLCKFIFALLKLNSLHLHVYFSQ